MKQRHWNKETGGGEKERLSDAESIPEKWEEMDTMGERHMQALPRSLCSQVTEHPARGHSRHKRSNRVNTHFH